MKRSLLYEVSEGRRGETAIGVAWHTHSVFETREFCVDPAIFFLGREDGDLKELGKIGRYLDFETWKSSFSDFKMLFLDCEIAYMKQATSAFVCLRF